MLLLLLLWICVCINSPVQVQGALVLSQRAGLRQFYHGVEFEVTDSHPGEVEGKVKCDNVHKRPNHQCLSFTRHYWEKDSSRDVKTGKNVLCWFVNDVGHGLIDGSASDYTVPHLFTF